jgi:hypothetical protein
MTKLNFSFIPQADYRYPLMLQSKANDLYTFGEMNDYPYYLLDIYKKSAKHNAIINGKCNYIAGKGWAVDADKTTVAQQAKAEAFMADVNEDDDLNDLTQKFVLDLELFNGFALAVTWNRGGGIAFIEHVPFEKVRVSLDDTMFLIADWYDERMIRQYPKGAEVERMPKFDPNNRVGKQLFYYRHYAAGVKHYPLPNYQGALAYIECDVEIAKFHISNIRNQFWGGQMINFADGIPTDEEKQEIERQMRNKFSGANNAGRFVLTFSTGKENAPSIQSLTPSDLDKQFDLLNKQIQEEIFVAHNVTSPMLFGIRTEGQLGGRKELSEAYELFKNTYIMNRVLIVERMINYLTSFNGYECFYLQPFDPITEQLSEQALMQILTQDELREKAGYEPLAEATPDAGEVAVEASVGVNEAIKTLSGRQYQNLMRIVRHYSQGKVTLEQARTMLTAGFGLNPEQVDQLLGVKEQAFSDEADELEFLAQVGQQFGEARDSFEVLQERELDFNEYGEAEFFMQFAISDEDKALDEKIVKYRRKREDATVEEMAKEFGVSKARIRKRIQYLLQVNKYPLKRGIGEATKEEKVPEPIVEVRYRYDWRPEYRGLSKADGYDKSRKFCQVMMDLSSARLYTRDDINQLTALMGYSVWERRGGWLTLEDGRHRPSCRHMWVQQLVIKKGTQVERIVE